MGSFKCIVTIGLVVAAFVIIDGAPAGVPPLISFQDGKLGVNFFGYHAAVGLGGTNGQGGAAGGLHAEAGTPFGQRAAAGLRGNVGQGENTAGELYAGATAGGNIKAAAGLGGAVVGGQRPLAIGSKYAVAGVPGAASGYSENRVSNGQTEVVESTAIGHQPQPPHSGETSNEVVVRKQIRKKVHAPRPQLSKRVEYQVNSRFAEDENKSYEDEVPVAPVAPSRNQVTHVYHKSVPSFSSFGSVYLDSFLSPQYEAPDAVQTTKVVYHSSPDVQKRVSYEGNAHPGTFFQDIFNIPISALSAVSTFLTNSAQHAGNINVQKTVSVHGH